MKKSHLAILLNILVWVPRLYSVSVYLSMPKVFTIPAIKINFMLYMNGFAQSLAIFYTFYFLISPVIFSRKKRSFLDVLLFGVAEIIIVSIIGYAISNSLAPPKYIGAPAWYTFISDIMLNMYSAFTACLIRSFLNWYADIFYKKQLEKKNTETELALLKAQINPHFLFNTLNNIDVLIEKDAAKSSVYLKKLSDILRFMLYESPLEKIPLTQELEYIHKYIELQKIRTSNSNYVTFEVEGDTGHILIAPMLFIPFIENAFKHSVNKKIDNAIEVKLSADENKITFYCSNAYDAPALQTQLKSGLGLELIKNRLKLLYRDNYNLAIDKADNRFIVNLTITINDDQLHYN